MAKFIPYLLVLISGILFGLSYTNINKKEGATIETEVQSKEEDKTIKPFHQTHIEKINSLEDATIRLFDANVQSVAFITTSNIQRGFWNRNLEEKPHGSGSGFIWDKEGHIVTNYHVIKGANKATVTLNNQKSYEAVFVGAEPNKDLAVLKIEAPKEELQTIKVGSSEALKVGQSVFAIGNPFGLDYTLTTGIISALGREITSTNNVKIREVIQTDAAINPGNSGGPLLNSNGQLIGVNTAIYSPSGAYAGIGFSIPVDVVKWVVPDLIQYGYVKKPVLGIELLSNQQRMQFRGAMISQVIPGKGAEKAGLRGITGDQFGRIRLGDIIIKIDDTEIESNSDLILALEKHKVGDVVKVTYLRDQEENLVELTLSEN